MLLSQRTSGWGSRVRVIYEETYTAVFSPDSRFILSSSDSPAKLWDVATGTQLYSTSNTSDRCEAVAFSPDGQSASCGFEDGTVELWTIAPWAKQAVLPRCSNSSVVAVTFTPDSKSVVSAFADGTVRFWALAHQTQEVFITGCSMSFISLVNVVFSLDCRFMAAARCDDDAARAWKLVPGAPLDPLVIARLPDEKYYTVALSPDGCSVVFGAEDGIHVWDTATSTHRLTINGHSSRVTAVAFSRDGRSLVSGFDDATIMVWDFTAGAQQPDYVLKGHSAIVRSVAFSPDAKLVSSTSDDDTMRVWSGAVSVDESVMEGHTGAVGDLAFSHDGQHIASGSEDWTIRVWDAATGRQKYVLEGHKDGIKRVVFSPDSQTIASCSWDCTVRMWNVTTGTQVHDTLRHPWTPYDVVFSHDGQSVFVISDPNHGDPDEVYVWEVKTGTQRFVISLSLWEPHQLDWLIFSPSDQLVVAAFCSDATSSSSGRSDEQSIDYKVWDASTGVELAVQDLTPALARDMDGALLSQTEQAVAPYHTRMSDDGWIEVSRDEDNWHPVCWLPAERQSTPIWRPYACHDQKACIGAGSGAVTILDFSNVLMPWTRSV
jgi:WD40 repeat protein